MVWEHVQHLPMEGSLIRRLSYSMFNVASVIRPTLYHVVRLQTLIDPATLSSTTRRCISKNLEY